MPTWRGLPERGVARLFTFLGGTDYDLALGIDVDDDCHAYVMGWSWSVDYPTTPSAYQTTVNGYSDAFVTNVDPTAARRPLALHDWPDPDPQPKPVCNPAGWSVSGDGLDYALMGAAPGWTRTTNFGPACVPSCPMSMPGDRPRGPAPWTALAQRVGARARACDCARPSAA